jgi:Spy/CpxP family protein refolding chaperone
MKKLLLTMVLGSLVLTASFVSAAPGDAQRPPVSLRQMWACQCEDQEKLDKNFKKIEEEAAKLLETKSDKKQQPAR